MQRQKFILAFVFLPIVLCGQEFDFNVSFYNTQITLRADSDMMLNDQRMNASAENVNKYYHAMVIAPVDSYITSIKKQRKKNGLNDWLLFDLMEQSAEVLFPNASQNYKTLFLWYIASEIGWDLELYLAGHNASILVRTKETLFERDFYAKDDIFFVKIYPDEKPRGQDFKYQRFTPPFDNTNAAPFSFKLDSLPVLSDKPVNRDLTFIHNDISYSVSIKINQNALDLSEKYPIISQDFYFTVPLSHLALREIKKAFTDNLKTRTIPEGLIFLLSFVRTAFIYEPDMIQFRSEFPLTAEQTLFFAKSDCEDRSALFFQLVKTFYPEIPMIVLEFPEHVTVGVALPEASSLYPIIHKNRRYYICEPTNPNNELKLGQTTLADQNYKIIYDWDPPVKKSSKH